VLRFARRFSVAVNFAFLVFGKASCLHPSALLKNSLCISLCTDWPSRLTCSGPARPLPLLAQPLAPLLPNQFMPVLCLARIHQTHFCIALASMAISPIYPSQPLLAQPLHHSAQTQTLLCLRLLRSQAQAQHCSGLKGNSESFGNCQSQPLLSNHTRTRSAHPTASCIWKDFAVMFTAPRTSSDTRQFAILLLTLSGLYYIRHSAFGFV